MMMRELQGVILNGDNVQIMFGTCEVEKPFTRAVVKGIQNSYFSMLVKFL